MKTIILMILTLTLTTNIFAASTTQENNRLCKIFKDKVVTYKKTMRSDAYAQKTLESYKTRADIFCSK
ncbi:MAG: hypothetical protein QM497_07745 [Sulfurimonas sp.]